MNAQLENQQLKDMSTEELAHLIRGLAPAAVATLNERRLAAYATACEPFDEEFTALAVEAADIEEARANLERLLPAKAREAQREADRLMLDGKHEEAAAKTAEAEEAAEKLVLMIERRREIAERVEAIEAEKRTALRRTGEDFFEASIPLIRASETGLTLCLNAVRASLNSLETQVGTLYQAEQLTADARSEEWATLSRLYGGGVRW